MHDGTVSVKVFGVMLLCYESVEIHVIAALATTVIQQIVENIHFENTVLTGFNDNLQG